MRDKKPLQVFSIDNLISYLDKIFNFSPTPYHDRCYRGESDKKWKLISSVFRDVYDLDENRLFSKLSAEAPNEFNSDKFMFDKLVRAQHYGLPTRILDVSMNPLVALYFACAESKSIEADGKVRIIDLPVERTKYPDSDTVSLICNLGLLSFNEQQKIEQTANKPDFSDDLLRELPEIERLIQFVRMEKPYFLNKVKYLDLSRYYFVFPNKNNNRIIAQSGAFIMTGIFKFGTQEHAKGLRESHIIIPAECKNKILDELDRIGINEMSLFPGLEFTSKYIRKKSFMF